MTSFSSKSARIFRGTAMALALVSQLTSVAAAADDKVKGKAAEPKGPSLHVQCDGYPNNISSGESAARILGAVTLLGLFAPSREAADPGKRKFGKEGVEACNAVLIGEKAETHPSRKLELTMARAIHNIEAKNYDAALGDVALSRAVAIEAGFTKDPYFERSVGNGLNQMEAAILIRQGKAIEASKASLAQLNATKHQFWLMIEMEDYADFIRSDEPIIRANRDRTNRIYPQSGPSSANRLADIGKFAEAATMREAMIDYHLAFKPEQTSSTLFAAAALDHALSGNWTKAAERATFARENDKKRVAEGKPDTDRVGNAEILDLYEVLKLANEGNVKGARRMFTGRSEWLTPSLGAVMETNRRLSVGAAEDEKIGLLAKTPDQMWKAREDAKLAEITAKDSDNKTLFALINSYNKAANWEAFSKNTWYLEKSRMFSKKPDEKNGFAFISTAGAVYYGSLYAQIDSMILHSALTAKKNGYPSFMFIPLIGKTAIGGYVRFGKNGDPGMPELLTLNTDEVIAELKDVIPSPADLKLRRATADKTKK
jgi:hypothetical protein